MNSCKKQNLDSKSLIPVVETFYSIQGEGYNIGKAAYFIRVGGCDVCCTWCDEKKSWDERLYPQISMVDLYEEVVQSGTSIVVFTGGEPFKYDLSILTQSFQSAGIETMAETSGTEKITGKWDWIVLSPKQQKQPLEENYSIANELKVVIQKQDDLFWAKKCALKTNQSIPKYLQPEWSCYEKILPHIIHFIKEHPDWRLSVQTHKFLKIP